MSTPNPTNPQGSLLEQKAKRKNNLPVIVAIFLGIHAVVIGGILMVGCKPEPKPEAKRLPSPEPVLPPITTPPDPVTPVAPVNPVSPVRPLSPVAPVNPVRPVRPVTPVTPVTPVAPTAPK